MRDFLRFISFKNPKLKLHGNKISEINCILGQKFTPSLHTPESPVSINKNDIIVCNFQGKYQKHDFNYSNAHKLHLLLNLLSVKVIHLDNPNICIISHLEIIRAKVKMTKCFHF